ncbi:MAG: CpXC domain-containing protein [Anaerolineae bacterium]|nr:CpXC domain-containing protein [Anaerolineae bacterium]
MTILTPKGYSPARQPESEKPPAPPETPQPAAAPPQQAGRGQIQLHFPPQVIGVTCPNCNTPFPAQLFTIVDVGQDPVLKNVLLQGQLNVAVCPRCGSGGALTTPLLYHDPEHQFLGVYVPEQVGVNEQQKVIGDLSKRLMDGLPQEDRRGYMLTPKQFLSYQSLLEAILENEGVTREMMDKQRRQLQLIEQGLAALKDPEGLRLLAKESDADFDDQFFALLTMVTDSAAAGGDTDAVRELVELREQLIELTTWGEGVKRQRAAVAQLKPETTSEDLLNMVVASDDPRVAEALILSARRLADYSFFEALTRRIDAAQAAGNTREAERLTDLRQRLLETLDRYEEMQQATLQQYTQILGDILASDDIQRAVMERAQYIDQTFISIVGANLEDAKKRGAGAAVRRLQEVWDAAIELLNISAGPEVELLNELLSAEYPAGTRKILSENREIITPDFIDALEELIDQVSSEGADEVAQRLRQIRSQAQLMM